MSEGDTFIQLFRGPIPEDAVKQFSLGSRHLGGVVTFAGIVRGESDPQHGDLLRLEYEAYESMALRQMHQLAATAIERWQAGRVAIVHQLGAVQPGEISVLIVVACPHRAEAFEACRWIIDTLKKDVPIWKKDVYADGHVAWVEPSPPGSHGERD